MQINKAFVNPNNVATITCPQCRKARNIDATKFRRKRHTIKVRCSCSFNFKVLLDFRKNFRKETNLDGKFVMIPPAVGSGAISVLNLSKSGIRFSIGSAVKGSQKIIPGLKLKVTFQLDDKKRTLIEKTVKVNNIHDHYVGGEFEASQAFDKDLGFYLLS